LFRFELKIKQFPQRGRTSINQQYENFSKIIAEVLNEHAPMRKRKRKRATEKQTEK